MATINHDMNLIDGFICIQLKRLDKILLVNSHPNVALNYISASIPVPAPFPSTLD